jgi:hypothetical protein
MRETPPLVETRQIRVFIAENSETGLLVALSHDMRGLTVTGKSEAEIETALPGVLRSLLEAKGRRVLSVTMEPGERDLPAGFTFPSLIASAELAA